MNTPPIDVFNWSNLFFILTSILFNCDISIGVIDVELHIIFPFIDKSFEKFVIVVELSLPPFFFK